MASMLSVAPVSIDSPLGRWLLMLSATTTTERKVLYPGNSYELGRGSVLLHLAQTVVSTHHATITVGPHPVESAASVYLFCLEDERLLTSTLS